LKLVRTARCRPGRWRIAHALFIGGR
jgi:hypothetical protein